MYNNNPKQIRTGDRIQLPREGRHPACYGTAVFSGWGITKVRWDHSGNTSEIETLLLSFVSRPTEEVLVLGNEIITINTTTEEG